MGLDDEPIVCRAPVGLLRNPSASSSAPGAGRRKAQTHSTTHTVSEHKQPNTSMVQYSRYISDCRLKDKQTKSQGNMESKKTRQKCKHGRKHPHNSKHNTLVDSRKRETHRKNKTAPDGIHCALPPRLPLRPTPADADASCSCCCASMRRRRCRSCNSASSRRSCAIRISKYDDDRTVRRRIHTGMGRKTRRDIQRRMG